MDGPFKPVHQCPLKPMYTTNVEWTGRMWQAISNPPLTP